MTTKDAFKKDFIFEVPPLPHWVQLTFLTARPIESNARLWPIIDTDYLASEPRFRSSLSDKQIELVRATLAKSIIEQARHGELDQSRLRDGALQHLARSNLRYPPRDRK